jgi:hypothetical protein
METKRITNKKGFFIVTPHKTILLFTYSSCLDFILPLSQPAPLFEQENQQPSLTEQNKKRQGACTFARCLLPIKNIRLCSIYPARRHRL